MTSEQKILLLLIPIAYLLGSVPFGLLVGKAKGIDVRAAGSKNIGATNVGRLLGGKYFALVFVLDLIKGMGPMLAGGIAVGFFAADSVTSLLWLGIGFAAIFGHMFSLFLGFRGGKGVATSAGVVLGLFPYFTFPALIALAVWGAIFFKTRIVSLASIIAAIFFPIAYAGFAVLRGWNPLIHQLPLLIFAILMALMIVYRHRANIGRLRAGTEYRFGRTAAQRTGTNGDRLPSGNGDHAGDGDSAAPHRP